MSKKIAVPRGTTDILPTEIANWQAVEQKARNLLELYGYREIRTPIFEETDLFARSMGQATDVVQKQLIHVAGSSHVTTEKVDIMESLTHFALRPEGTAPVVRSYIENSLDKTEQFSKLFYIGPMFRGERPQKGRLRQFHQIGVEAIGPESGSPYLDAEVISLSVRLLKYLGLNDFNLKINTLGSTEDKEKFSQLLRKQLKDKVSKLCPTCQERYERNVFRILDCKNKDCKAVVDSIDVGHSYLSAESQKYYSLVKESLSGLGIAFEESKKLVRGLDYYTHTVFEISSAALGSQDALGAGGRYNNLVEQLDGPKVDAIGFALGIERILLALPADQKQAGANKTPAFLLALDEAALQKGFVYLDKIRSAILANSLAGQVSIDMNYRLGSMKSLMRLANKVGTKYVLILGEEELKNNSITFKDMTSGAQEKLALADIQSIVERLGKV